MAVTLFAFSSYLVAAKNRASPQRSRSPAFAPIVAPFSGFHLGLHSQTARAHADLKLLSASLRFVFAAFRRLAQGCITSHRACVRTYGCNI